MAALDTDGDGKVSLREISDNWGDPASLRGEFSKALREADEDGNCMFSVDEAIEVVDDRASREALNVSLLTIEDSIFEVEATTDDTHLGGADLRYGRRVGLCLSNGAWHSQLGRKVSPS